MVIRNTTTGDVIADNAGQADTTLARMKGLLGRSGMEPGEALVITPCVSIHTIGMRFPIDVVFFDASYKAVKALKHIKPNRLTTLYMSAKGVIELPAGTLDRSPVNEGDEIEIV